MMHWHRLADMDGYGKCREYTSGNWRLERRAKNSSRVRWWVLSVYRTDSKGLYTRWNQGWFSRMRDAKAAAERQVARARDVLEGQQ